MGHEIKRRNQMAIIFRKKHKGLMCSEYNSDCNKYSYYCQHCICALLEVHDHILK
jgi:hypothetical protein